MPETFILYRFFFEWLDEIGEQGTEHWRKTWAKCQRSLSSNDWSKLTDYIHQNTFSEQDNAQFTSIEAQELLAFYLNFRKDIINPDTKLYQLKCQYDSNPTIELRKKKS